MVRQRRAKQRQEIENLREKLSGRHRENWETQRRLGERNRN